jgi:hypothetical protein
MHLGILVRAGQQSRHLRHHHHHQTRARIPLPMTRLQTLSLPQDRARTQTQTQIQPARLLLITSYVVFLVLHRRSNTKGSHLSRGT